MSARALLNAVELMIIETVGREEYEDMLHPIQENRSLAVLALGGEVA